MYSYQKFRSKTEVRGPCTHRNRFVLYIFETDHGWKKYVLDGSSQSGIFSAPSGLLATVYAAPVLVEELEVAITELAVGDAPVIQYGKRKYARITWG